MQASLLKGMTVSAVFRSVVCSRCLGPVRMQIQSDGGPLHPAHTTNNMIEER
jgi:hypothetical protein